MRKLWLRTVATVTLLMMLTGAAVAGDSGPRAPAGDVALRAAAEGAGAQVDWDGATQTVTVTRDRSVLTVVIGADQATVNGRPVRLDQPAYIAHGRTQIERALLSEALGVPLPAAGEPIAAPAELPALALELVQSLTAGTADALRPRFSPDLAAAVPDGALAQVPIGLSPYGGLVDAVVVGQRLGPVHHEVDIVAVFEQAPLSVSVRFDGSGRIDDFSLLPYVPVEPAGPPPYADPSAFTEHELVIGASPWLLPATLSLPAGPGPFPAVVLVHGSGPQDRDETVYGAKVFRDLAQGLASRGVAVLRFEKRTRQHGQKFGADPTFTLWQESVADIAAALGRLGREESIDRDAVFVLGHSMGGIAAARLLSTTDGDQAAGLILVATPNRLYDALIEQNRLLVESGQLPPQQLPFITAQFAMLQDLDFDPDQPPALYQIGTPHYWADLRGETAEWVKGHQTPLLIVQGGRDWQVPADQLASWQQALAEREGVTYRLFAELSHILAEGEAGPAALEEYLAPQHVAGSLVAEIAAWVLATAGR